MSMRRIIFFVILFFSFFALSHQEAIGHEGESGGDSSSEDIRILKEINLVQGGKVYVTARQAGHILGQQFQVEVRVSCLGEVERPGELEVSDSFSVCDMDPDSLVVNRSGTAVAMKTKMAKVFSETELLSGENRNFYESCASKTEIKKFSLRNLCQ